MSQTHWDNLLNAARTAHERHSALSDFCPFPDDLTGQAVTPHDKHSADLMAAEKNLGAIDPLDQAFLDTGPHATWRETYKGSKISNDFMERFGCYCLVGGGGGFTSNQMSAYVVYMPAGLDYPWHHHPAEELYLVLAGQAEFHRDGEAPETLSAGQVSQHASNQPHATNTKDHPLLAYVLWRNELATPPVWTDKSLW